METLLREHLEKYLSGPQKPATPANLSESIRYSLLAPGKRIRPRLALACAKMVGLSAEAALPAALAIEMIHCFTLIHDDLPCMDNDDFRRGRPSNHRVFGESLALLAGDGLIALALDVFLDSAKYGVPPDRVLAGLRRLNWAMGTRGVIGGQAAESLVLQHPGLQQMEEMHSQKTGALFSASLLIPMDLQGISEQSAGGRAIAGFAQELGLAFQVADDLEDASQDSKQTAQPPTSILYYLSPDEARPKTRERLSSAKKLLAREWGQAASELERIADEVLRKLETHS